MKHPEPQLPPEQTSPAAQPVPFARLVQAVVLVADWQLWHALAGFVVPAV
jgi:hypothetical protein